MNEKTNPYEKPCKELFAKLNITFGLLFHLVNHLSNYRESVKQLLIQNGFEISDMFAGSALVIRDLTEWPEDNWARYYSTGNFISYGESYLSNADDLIYREAAWTISQAYEAFETYLKGISASYIYKNPDSVNQSLFTKHSKSLINSELKKNSLEYWNKFVRLSYRSGKDALNFLRKEAPSLSEWEKQNNRNNNLTVWFKIVSEVRHATTHSNLLIDNAKLSSLPNTEVILMNKYFPGIRTKNGYELRITQKSAETALIFFGEYAFLLFKCLSIKNGYNWQALLNQSKMTG